MVKMLVFAAFTRLAISIGLTLAEAGDSHQVRLRGYSGLERWQAHSCCRSATGAYVVSTDSNCIRSPPARAGLQDIELQAISQRVMGGTARSNNPGRGMSGRGYRDRLCVGRVGRREPSITGKWLSIRKSMVPCFKLLHLGA